MRVNMKLDFVGANVFEGGSGATKRPFWELVDGKVYWRCLLYASNGMVWYGIEVCVQRN